MPSPTSGGSWKDGWAKRGVYVNNFLFLPDQVGGLKPTDLSGR
jgi:hypothetical protein